MDDEINDLIIESLKNGLSMQDITNCAYVSQRNFKYKKDPYHNTRLLLACSLIVVLLACKNADLFSDPYKFYEEIKEDYGISFNETCLVHHNGISIEVTRPLAKCTLCRGFKKVPVATNMTKDYFLQFHAYSGVPVLVKNSISNWSALNTFSFQYFRKLYDELEAYQENNDLGCQFFSYKTDFKDLKHVLHMKKERSSLKKDQWYIGWGNCVPRVMKSLRKHYEKPNFLPDDSESSHLDWMFMGGSGIGADMHIDAVNRPSWQAMIKGKKTWYLEPPPECETVCERHLKVTMEPGDILVVDTNRWYHSTYIHPGNMSITIGSEYD